MKIHAISYFSAMQEHNRVYCFTKYIRSKLVENTGSRLLSQSQATKRWISSWVGDDQRIPGVVCSVFLSLFLPYLVTVLPSVGSQCDAQAPSKKSIDGLFRGRGLEGAGHSIPLVIAESLLKGKG